MKKIISTVVLIAFTASAMQNIDAISLTNQINSQTTMAKSIDDPYDMNRLWEEDIESDDEQENYLIYQQVVAEAYKEGKTNFKDSFYKDMADIIWSDPMTSSEVKMVQISNLWNSHINNVYPPYLDSWIKDGPNNVIINDIEIPQPDQPLDSPIKKPEVLTPNKIEDLEDVKPEIAVDIPKLKTEIYEIDGKYYEKIQVQNAEKTVVVNDVSKEYAVSKGFKEGKITSKSEKDELLSIVQKQKSQVTVGPPTTEEEQAAVQIQNQKTVFFTLNKNDGYPLFEDTGVMSLDHEKISYKDIKDILSIVSKKQDKRIYDEGERLVTVISGQIVIVNAPSGEKVSSMDIKAIENSGTNPYVNEDGSYEIAYINISQLNEILAESSIAFEIQDTRESATLNLVDYIERGGTFKLFVNSEEVKLDIPPRIVNSRMMFSIGEISKKLGGNVEWDKKKREATITGNSSTMIFKENDNNVIVNGSPEDLEVSIIIEGERMLAPVKYIVEQLGAEMKWDAKKFEVHIDSKQ